MEFMVLMVFIWDSWYLFTPPFIYNLLSPKSTGGLLILFKDMSLFCIFNKRCKTSMVASQQQDVELRTRPDDTNATPAQEPPHRIGVGRFSPKVLQCFNTPKWFAVFAFTATLIFNFTTGNSSSFPNHCMRQKLQISSDQPLYIAFSASAFFSFFFSSFEIIINHGWMDWTPPFVNFQEILHSLS